MHIPRFRTSALAGLVVAAATLVSPASAQPCDPEELAKLLASDGAMDDEFGQSVSVWGDVAVIGAAIHHNSGSGMAYVFRKGGTGWVEEAILVPTETGLSGGPFTVSIWDDTIVIGAPADGGPGAAYVFRHDGTNWVQEAKLTSADGANRDEFGWSVSVSGETAVIGAYLDDDAGNRSGSAYIFRYDDGEDDWVEEAKLLAGDGEEDDFFGVSVSISGDTVVVGANGDEDGSSGTQHRGMAYVFRYDDGMDDWVEEAKLTASDEFTLYYFGESVSISGDTIVIGAPGADNGDAPDFPVTGAAYIFRFDGTSWVEEAKLLAIDGEQDDSFGVSVSISGNTAVIGTSAASFVPNDPGSAYIFRYDDGMDDWVEEAKLLASDGEEDDFFGWSVSVFDDTAVIGAYLDDDDDNGDRSGSAYIFDLNCIADCLADVNGDGVLTPADYTAWIDAFNNNLPGCDQNGDGLCTPADHTAWIANYNAGCP